MSKLVTTTVKFKHKDRILPPGSLIHIHDEDATELVKAGKVQLMDNLDPFAVAHFDYESEPVDMPECGSVNPFRTELAPKAAKPVEVKQEQPKAKKQHKAEEAKQAEPEVKSEE